MSPEEKREYARRWRAANPDKARAWRRKYRSENREKRAEQVARWRKKNPEKVRAQQLRYVPAYRERRRELNLLRKYGITPERYQQMLSEQGGACKICSRYKGEPLVVDHDHSCCQGGISCGKCLRGLLCRQCNAALGHMGDSYDVIVAAAEYIKEWRG